MGVGAVSWQENVRQRGADIRAKFDHLEKLSHNRQMEQLEPRPSCPPLRQSLISPKSRLFEPEEVLAQSQLSSVQVRQDHNPGQTVQTAIVAEVAAVHNSTKQLESILEKAWTSISKELSSDKKGCEGSA